MLPATSFWISAVEDPADEPEVNSAVLDVTLVTLRQVRGHHQHHRLLDPFGSPENVEYRP
jgi:hypothetical protein